MNRMSHRSREAYSCVHGTECTENNLQECRRLSSNNTMKMRQWYIMMGLQSELAARRGKEAEAGLQTERRFELARSRDSRQWKQGSHKGTMPQKMVKLCADTTPRKIVAVASCRHTAPARSSEPKLRTFLSSSMIMKLAALCNSRQLSRRTGSYT